MGNRIISLDLLRIAASFTVVFWHVCLPSWNKYSVSSIRWKTITMIRMLTRWTNGVYVMISGSFFLNNEHRISIRKLYTTYIWRTIRKRTVWGIVYLLFHYLRTHSIDNRMVIMYFLNGYRYHWFLNLICGLYVITPLLRKITEEKALLIYAQTVCLISGCLIPSFKQFSVYQYFDGTLRVFQPFNSWTGLYLSGFFFCHFPASLQTRLVFYLAGILSIVYSYILTDVTSQKTGSTVYSFCDDRSLVFTFPAVAVFILFRSFSIKPSQKASASITEAAKITFGVFLIHPLFLTIMEDNNINLELLPYPVSIPLCSILLFSVSYGASYLISKSLILSKWLL